MFKSAIVGVLLACATSLFAAELKNSDNILNLAAGSVLISTTSEYGGAWSAIGLITGGNGWSSAKGHTQDNQIVFELPQAFQLKSITLDNSHSQETNYPGISARAVEIWGSAVSPTSGYTKLATLEALKGARKEFSLSQGAGAQWLKIVVKNNWGHQDYTELSGLEVRGTPVGVAAARPSISAVYDTNYGPLNLVQNGSSISGCYYNGDGKVTGATDGRTINFEWRQGGGKSVGSALMVLTSRGDFLNGVWYSNGIIQGTWFGTRGTKAVNCSPVDNLENDLQVSGRAVLYGIRFASDSVQVTADSSVTLGAVLALMKKQPALKLRVEGHTDSTNTDQYNLQLSKRRATAVTDWLVQHGAAASRLSAEGFGSARPVADNVTAQGRMLNRRVEISLMK